MDLIPDLYGLGDNFYDGVRHGQRTVETGPPSQL
jgi:hypothetical protein